jgi:hypothetical protein
MKNRFGNLSGLFGALILGLLPACGGGGGSASAGGSSGSSANNYSQLDLVGAWIGELTPRENSGLPWSDGEQRILSRTFYTLADGDGMFQFLQDGSDLVWDTARPDTFSETSAINGKGLFTIGFKVLDGSRAELVFVARINQARNYIHGEYELRMHTQPGQPDQSEPVDAGTFEMTLSGGAGHFVDSMFEGEWVGQNYTYAPRYLNCRLTINDFGDVTDGGMFDQNGQKQRMFKTDGTNDAIFDRFDDSSVGRFDGAILEYQGGRVLEILFLLMDETGTWLTGPAIDINGKVSYLRLQKQ